MGPSPRFRRRLHGAPTLVLGFVVLRHLSCKSRAADRLENGAFTATRAVAKKGHARTKLNTITPRAALGPAAPEWTAWSGRGLVDISSEFRRALDENPYPDKLNLCFPNHQLIIEALQRSTADYTSNEFLMNVHAVFMQLHVWPSAWPGLISLLDAKHPWTQSYCSKVIASQEWSPFQFFSVNLDSLRPLQRYSLEELREQSSKGYVVLDRWLTALEASPDPTTKTLLEQFKAQDAKNKEEQVMRLRPLEDLLEHLLSKVVQQIFEACAWNPQTISSILERRNDIGRTVLHHAAEQGNTVLAELILQSAPASDPARYVGLLDNRGYSAEDLARLSHFSGTAEKIRSIGGTAASRAPAEPVKLFPAGSRAEPPADLGGWSDSDAGAVPAEWLPPENAPCDIDCIGVSQFDWDVFEKHYLGPRRPLLVRGGVQLSTSERICYARDGLLEVAGDRKVRAFSTPYEDDFRDVPPLEMSIRDYAAFLDERCLSGTPSNNLSYVFDRLPADEGPLRFVRALPSLFQGKVQQRTTQFTLGGVLMGSPLHYHIDAVNSLVYGRKLWLLKPPAEQEFRKTVVYKDLTQGSPTGLRVLQEAGDLLYVPRGWVHGVVCLNHCVGMAHEFDPIVSAGSVSSEGVSLVFSIGLALAVLFVIAFVFFVSNNF